MKNLYKLLAFAALLLLGASTLPYLAQAGACASVYVGGSDICYPNIPKAHTVLLGEGANKFGTTSPSTAGYVLTSNGVNADPTFQASAASTASGVATTSLQATTPLTVTKTTSAITYGIPQASGSANGYLSSTDWNTFNGKGTVSSVSATVPTGLTISGSPITTSGTLALALQAGYNIPLTASTTNWNSAYNTVNTNSANWTTAYTDRITSASAPLAIASNALSISQANTSTNGYLSSTDWNTFNGKQGAITLTTTGTSGAATFASNTLNIPQYAGTTYTATYPVTLTGSAFGLAFGTTTANKWSGLQTFTSGFTNNATSTGTFGINLSGGCFAKNGVCIGGSGGSGTVTSVAATVPTGLTISGSPITTSGTLAFGLQSGYIIPLIASTTNWNNFYNTPSTRITAGTGLSWTGNTLNSSGGSTLMATGTPSGTVNGTNTVFTTANLPLLFFVNGVYQKPSTDYNVTGSYTETFGTAPASGSILTYTYSSLGSGVSLPLSIANGGLGFSTAPTYGKVLVGNALGGYTLTATSSLGIAGGGGTVTSVALSTPTGLSISGSPITTSGTLALSLTSGYNIPLTASTTNWNSAYNGWNANNANWSTAYTDRITSVVNDTNVTGSIASNALTLGWTGTLADARIASATNWNTAYTDRITSASAPLAIASNVLSIAQAATGANGYLSSTDWNTFNNKQGAITLTTTGTSGAATFSGGTLNIPQYAGTTYTAGAGLALAGGAFSLDLTHPNTWTALQQFNKGATTTQLTISGQAAASGTNCLQVDTLGFVSKTGSACGAGGGGSPGGLNTQLQYNNSGAFGGIASLVWNATKSILGLGTTTPWLNNSLSLGSTTPVLAATRIVAASTAIKLGMASSSNIEVDAISTSAYTITYSKYELAPGQKQTLVTCNGASIAGALTFSNVHFSGGVQPGNTTAASQCDMWYLETIAGTSTPIVVLTGQTSGVE